MKFKTMLCSILFLGIVFNSFSQLTKAEITLSKIRNEGFNNSHAMQMLSQFTDIYGPRLTGTNEYFEAAKWVSNKMKEVGLQNVHFEKFCETCRGWDIKGFNIEMIAPNYMHINGYPLTMTKSTDGIVSGELVHIESFKDMDNLKVEFAGKLEGKIILLGKAPRKKPLSNSVSNRYSEKELKKMQNQLSPEVEQTPLPELLESWETQDVRDEEFLQFVEAEGALAVFKTRAMYLGVLHPDGTYYYEKDDLKPLPYFTIMPEHFGRMLRMLEEEVVPVVRLNLETSFYHNPENNVNIIGEITGNDPKLKTQTVMVGAHFDSWHSGTGATDNGANSIVLVEALRILKHIGYSPKRTIKIGLWGGEEQAFLGSVSYATDHYGKLNESPNKNSTKVSAYLNLDNGAGAIRGVYLQGNEFTRPVFNHILKPVADLSDGVLTIENTLSTDHETFDHYNIPSFQFIQDELAYNTVTHHTNLDVLEYVPENDIMKNAVILAWTIYSLAEMEKMVPRKTK